MKRSIHDVARSGDFTQLKKMKATTKAKMTVQTLKCAVESGNMKMCEWILENDCPAVPKHEKLILITRACDSGSMDVLRWVCDTFAPILPGHMNVGRAAAKGRLDMVKLLAETASPYLNSGALKTAAKLGHMYVVQWLVEKRRVKFDNAQSVCATLADEGEFEMLKYVIKHGGKADYQACERAAYQGNIEILKYLHEIGCEWNYSTCVAAASGGHLDCLKYARDNGCEWNRHVYHAAVEADRLHIMEYLRINDCPLPSLDVLKDAYEDCVFVECRGLSDDDLSDEDNFRHIYDENIILATIYAIMRELKAAAAIKKAQNEESSAIVAMKSLMSTIDANKKRVPENEYLKMCEKAQTIFDMMKRP